MLMAEEAGLSIDQNEFEEAMERSKEVSRSGGKKGGEGGVKLDVHDLAVLEKDGVSKTLDEAKFGKRPLLRR